MLQAVYEAVDSAEASARLFFTDFTKGFDLIYHITGARAGQTRSPSCPPEMAPSSLNQRNSVGLANSEKRSILLGQN